MHTNGKFSCVQWERHTWGNALEIRLWEALHPHLYEIMHWSQEIDKWFKDPAHRYLLDLEYPVYASPKTLYNREESTLQQYVMACRTMAGIIIKLDGVNNNKFSALEDLAFFTGNIHSTINHADTMLSLLWEACDGQDSAAWEELMNKMWTKLGEEAGFKSEEA